MGDKFLRADGYVEWRPDPRLEERLMRRGGHVMSRGQLCTACLVGDWGMSLLKSTKTLCDDCIWLDRMVAERSGLDDRTRAGRAAPGDALRLGGANDLTDLTWEPIRAARRVRDAQLADVFAIAAERGVPVIDLDDPSGPLRVIDCDDVTRFDLIADGAEERVRRVAEWMWILAPEDYAARADALADVDGLALALLAHRREVRRSRARAEVNRAVRDVADGLTSVWRAPHTLGAAMAGVVRAQRRGESR